MKAKNQELTDRNTKLTEELTSTVAKFDEQLHEQIVKIRDEAMEKLHEATSGKEKNQEEGEQREIVIYRGNNNILNLH